MDAMLTPTYAVEIRAARRQGEMGTHARVGLEVLGLDRLKPKSRLLKAHRFYWFYGRILALEALGRVVEEHGSVAARMCADAVLARLDEGLHLTTREGAYVVREAAHRLADVRAVNGPGGRA
jgi:hypothetical protein